MTNVSICNILLAIRGLHSGTESDSYRLAELFFTIKIVPALVVHPLAEKLNRGLSTVFLLLRHIEVINEENGMLSELGSVDTLTTLVHEAINDTLGLVSRGLGRKCKTQECPFIILETIVKLIQHGNRFSSSS